MLTPGPIAYAVTAPQALHVNMWTEPLYGVECVYTVSPPKNSSGPFTDVGFKFLDAGPKKSAGQAFALWSGTTGANGAQLKGFA